MTTAQAALRWALGATTALGLVTAGAIVLSPREPECVRFEPHEYPDRSDTEVVAHLRRDLADARARADAFSVQASRRPLISDSVDAVAGARTIPERARAWCAAVLEEQIVLMHRATPGQIRQARTGTAEPSTAQAEAERTIGTEPRASGVVSLP